ncbi:MAG: hypothetical protein AAF658_05365 [Myxococcota bacterium]
MSVQIKPIGPDVYEVRGEHKMSAGWFFPLRTVIARTPTGGLWVHSPLRLEDSLAAEVDALGAVEFLIAPSNLHHLYMQPWKGRWPSAKMIGARGLRKKRPDLVFDATLDEHPEMPGFETVFVDGAPTLGESVFFHVASKTLICTDLMFNLGPANTRGFLTPWILRMANAYGRPAQSRLVRMATKDRERAGHSVRRILEWPFERIAMAHGDIVETDAKATLTTACQWMLEGASAAV